MDYATGTGVVNATVNGTTPPSISTAKSYRSVALGSLYSSNVSGNFVMPNVTLNSTTGFTVCFWLYLTATTAGMIWTANASSIGTRVFIYNNGTSLRFSVNSGANNDIFTYSINTWYFVTLVQPPGGVPYAMWNNASSTNLTSYAAGTFTTAYHMLVGDPSVANNYGGALGYINNLYLFPRALNASEITALYNQGA